MNKQLLEGKVTIITGASIGIGYEIARMFAEEGSNVLMIARREEVLNHAVDSINAMGFPGKAAGMTGDVIEEETSRRAFEKAIELFGKVDIVINNAGCGETDTIETTSTEHYDHFMNLLLRAPFFFNREASAYFLKTGEGVVINISSINGVKPGSGLTYCTAKAGLNNMTKSMAIRFAGTKVRVNTLSPGVTGTVQTWDPPKPDEGTVSMRQFSKYYINDSFNGEMPARAMAYGALFLASEMGEYITGQNLIIEKGRFMPC